MVHQFSLTTYTATAMSTLVRETPLGHDSTTTRRTSSGRDYIIHIARFTSPPLSPFNLGLDSNCVIIILLMDIHNVCNNAEIMFRPIIDLF